eukprot:4845421-Pyramimonas_sp.AAC.1
MLRRAYPCVLQRAYPCVLRWRTLADQSEEGKRIYPGRGPIGGGTGVLRYVSLVTWGVTQEGECDRMRFRKPLHRHAARLQARFRAPPLPPAERG